jgi:two-component system chemotaxis response regulator CheY
MVTKRCLEIAGYQEAIFLEAETGKQALDLAKNHQVDLLITDINMPEMDGKALLMRVKSSPKLADLPVLVISSLSNPAKENELIELGAFAVLSKPISPASLTVVLQSPSEQEDTQWGA